MKTGASCFSVVPGFQALINKIYHELGEIANANANAIACAGNEMRRVAYLCLHGRLADSPNETDLDRLLISSGDFGLAHLTARWAARFISELFRNHIGSIIGCSINDPVMRYVMDTAATAGQLRISANIRRA